MSSKKSTDFPYEFKQLELDKIKGLSEDSLKYLQDFLQVGPQKFGVPKYFAKEAASYYNFPLRQNDIFVMGYPRSGTTMTQELVWLVVNNFNFKLAAEKSLTEKALFLEARAVFCGRPDIWNDYSPKLEILQRTPEILEKMTTRRVIKTHIPFTLLPESLLTHGCKVVYIARNPRDVVVSLYHWQISIGRITGSFEIFFQLFVSDLNLFGPYWAHLQQGWERRFSKNVFFLFYEELIKDKRNTLKKMFHFLGEDLTEFQLDVIDFVSDFDNFKKYISQGVDEDLNSKEDVNGHFIRKGQIGNKKDYFTKEMDEKFKKWCRENLERTGIKFPIELI